MAKVFIDGREGTTGLRIQERLSGREDIELILPPEALRKDPATRAASINGADIVFLCLPDAAATEAVAWAKPGVKIIDASTAHRTQPGWAYGFPELSEEHRRRIVEGARVAVPGCHASGFTALVYPLVSAGLLSKGCPIVCHSVTGYSGGGKKMIAEYEARDRNSALDSPRQYGLSQVHKHLPEMQAISGLHEPPLFTPIVADFYSGMVVTIPIHGRLLSRPAPIDAVRRIYSDHYAGQKLIHVLDQDNAFLPANALAGRDDMEIAVYGNDERMVLTARFDNLGKGASGAAVQCMNLMLGLDETVGLHGDLEGKS